MSPSHAFRNILCAVFVLVTVSMSQAATDPDRAFHNANHSDPALMAASGQEHFVCGTYKGNQVESLWQHAEYEKKKRQMAALGVSAQPNSFTYQDVWIVEDDGTLLQSGNNPFDTDFVTIRFTPSGGGYNVSQLAQNFDAVVGTNLGLTDDGNSTQALQFAFSYYGVAWNDVYVNANGAVAFGTNINPSGFFDPNDFLSQTPKLCPFFIDLNPQAGGTVNFKSEATKATITWLGVPEFGIANSNTTQIVLYDNGDIDFTYNGVVSLSGNGTVITTGIHPGGTPTLQEISFSDDLPFGGASGVAIFEQYLNLVNPRVNEVALMQAFYQVFPDDFFQINFFTNFVQTMAGFANELNISNNVTGIGLGIFDNSALYGSAGVLESRCNMNRLGAWPIDPTQRFFGVSQQNFLTIMAQEAGHRWGAFVFFDSGGGLSNFLLGRANAHWNYYLDVEHSGLEGGEWDLVVPGQYSCPSFVDEFAQLDEYLFGLRGPEEVSPVFYVSSPSNNTSSARSAAPPPIGAQAFGTPVTVTIDDVIAGSGARTPTVDNEAKDVRQAFILIHQNGTTVSQQELDQVAGFRAAWEPYFEVSCDGRLTCNTSITQTFAIGSIKGTVKDETTTLLLDDFTVESVERGFLQVVPGGGKYFFRYMADANSGATENVTLMFSAPGFESEIVNTVVTFGQELCIDVRLRPVPTAIGDDVVPTKTAVTSTYPNPFNPATTVSYTVDVRSNVSLAIYDVAGRLVRRLLNENRAPGAYQVVWDAKDDAGQQVTSGVYFVRLDTETVTDQRKLVLLK